MKTRLILILSAGLILVTGSFILTHMPAAEPAVTTAETSPVKWMTYAQATAAAKKSPRPIFVDVYTDWCGWCKTMDKNTFSHPKIAEYLNRKYYCVKLNAETNDSTAYKGNRTTNAGLASRFFRVSSYPTTVYLEADETLLQPIPGYMDPNQFNKVIKFIGEGTYKTTTWDEFQNTFTETIQ